MNVNQQVLILKRQALVAFRKSTERELVFSNQARKEVIISTIAMEHTIEELEKSLGSDLIGIGAKVVIDQNEYARTGTLRGYTDLINGHKFCIIELDEGFYSKDDKTFVSLLVVHPSNIDRLNG